MDGPLCTAYSTLQIVHIYKVYLLDTLQIRISDFTLYTENPRTVSALEQFPPLNSFRICMYCDQRSQYIRLSSKKNRKLFAEIRYLSLKYNFSTLIHISISNSNIFYEQKNFLTPMDTLFAIVKFVFSKKGTKILQC